MGARRRSLSKATGSAALKAKWRSLGDLLAPTRDLLDSSTEEGVSGFEELRKHVKQGNEFTKEIAAVLQERSDAEKEYAKALSRISAKLAKAAQANIGTHAEGWGMVATEMEGEAELHRSLSQQLHEDLVKPLRTIAEGWGMVATEMEGEAELHRSLSQQLHEDLVKPLKSLADTQAKTRKPIEAAVDKAYKNFQDRHSDEAKCKKNAFTAAKDREKLCECVATGKDTKGKALSDKDQGKLEKQSRKSDDSLRKLDLEYQEASHKAEVARQDWDTAVFKGNSQLQNIEEERISQLQDLMNKYNNQLSVIGPKLIKSCEKLSETVLCVDTATDIRKVIEQKGTGANQPEQVLPDFYAEDMQNACDKERRRQMLQNYIIRYAQDLERETKSKEGIEKMVDVYTAKPAYADADTMDETRQRLAHVNATINYLEAAHHKLVAAMADLEGTPKPTHNLASYIERSRDKQGHMVSVLRLPASMVESYKSAVPPIRSQGDGHHQDSPFADRDGYLVPSDVYATLGRPHYWENSALGSDAARMHDFVEQQFRPCTQDSSSCGADSNHVTFRDPAVTSAQAEGQLGAAGSRDTIFVTPGAGVTLRCRNLTPQLRPRNANTVYRHTRVGSTSSWPYAEDEFDEQVRAIYGYTAQREDELSIQPGDVITVFEKQADGWWQGELGGKVGIFPGSYVEECAHL